MVVWSRFRISEKDLWIDERRGIVLNSQETSSQRSRNIVSPGSIDSQTNGAHHFDFSFYEGDSDADRRGLSTVAKMIVDITCSYHYHSGNFTLSYSAFTPSPQCQPKRRNASGMTRRRPFHTNDEERSACASAHLVSERICLIQGNVWSIEPRETGSCDNALLGVRIITAASEIVGVVDAVPDLDYRGIVFSIGHSIATSDTATEAVRCGARLFIRLIQYLWSGRRLYIETRE